MPPFGPNPIRVVVREQRGTSFPSGEFTYFPAGPRFWFYRFGWCGQWGWVDDVADSAARCSAEGRPRPTATMAWRVAAAEPDEPDLAGGSAAAAGRAGVDLDEQRCGLVGVGLPVGLGPAGGGAVEPGPADRVAGHRVGAAGPGAAVSGREFRSRGTTSGRRLRRRAVGVLGGGGAGSCGRASATW